MDGKLLAVQPDGEAEWVDCNYAGIKHGVRGATIDFVATTNLGCFVNDNGLAEQETLNWTASVMMFQPLFGPVVFTHPDPDDEGETLPADDLVYNAIENLASVVVAIHQRALLIGQDITVKANPDNVPPPVIVGMTDDWNFGDPLPPGPAPICPSCHAEAAWNGTTWVTAHEHPCAWLSNPESEPYP